MLTLHSTMSKSDKAPTKGKARRGARQLTMCPYMRRIVRDVNTSDQHVALARKDKVIGISGEASTNLSAIISQVLDDVVANARDSTFHNNGQTLTSARFAAVMRSTFTGELANEMITYAGDRLNDYLASFG
jgi:hypothetical protein